MDACVRQGIRNTNEIEEIINVDQIEVECSQGISQEHRGERRADQGVHKLAKRKTWPCEGVLVDFPEGANHHISYPFGIHSERSVPWNYRSTDDAFYIQAKSCQKTSSTQGGVCGNCQRLTSSTLFAGIMDRIHHGAHENVPLVLRFHRTSDHHISFCLIFPYLDPPSPYHTQIHRTAAFPFSLSLITTIVDRPLSYPVAPCLSLYRWLFPYLPVRYIDSQSGGTVGLGLCPLRLVTLLARVFQQYIRMYS